MTLMPFSLLLGKFLQVADSGWSNLLEIFHRMVPSNLFSVAVEGQLLGLICFASLFVLGKPSQSFRKTQLSFFGRITRNYSKDHPLHPTICPYWYFRLGHTHTSQKWLGNVLAMWWVCSDCFLSLGHSRPACFALLLKTFGGIKFIDHYRAMAPALLTAFSTASSSATLL